MQEEWITVAEARLRLGVSKTTMAQLVKKMEKRDNLLDKRSKLVRRSEVEALAAGGKPAKKLAA